MGCAPTIIWRPGWLDRGVWHVSINLVTSNETPQGPPDGTQGYWRLAIETSSIPSLYIFEAESEISSKVESKTVNKPNEPSRKSNRLKQEKIPRTLGHVELLLGLIDVVQCLRYLRREPSFKNNVASRGIQFAVRYCRPKESALRKLCTNIDQPYLIWDAALCRHVPPPKDQGYWDAQSNRPRRR